MMAEHRECLLSVPSAQLLKKEGADEAGSGFG